MKLLCIDESQGECEYLDWVGVEVGRGWVRSEPSTKRPSSYFRLYGEVSHKTVVDSFNVFVRLGNWGRQDEDP